MKRRSVELSTVMIALLLICPAGLQAQRVMENLGRGVVAVNQGEGKVFVSWRLLGTEPDAIGFNVYRTTGDAQPVKLNAAPLTTATCYQDSDVDLTKDNAYFVRPIVNGAEGEMSKPFLNRIKAGSEPKPYFEIPLELPQGTTANDATVADLDGDGEYEIVLKSEQRPRDTSQAGMTGDTILQGYKMDGTVLWTIHMGKNVREGAHDTQFMVYDLDGDGRAEVAVRTADGTIDGTGHVIGDANADWRNQNGRILTGPEYFTVFDGKTGKELASTKYLPERGNLGGWGGIGGNGGNDNGGNRANRFLACVAYLDGVLPSVIMCRGYYGRSVLAAWDWRDSKLTSRWVFDSSDNPNKGQPYLTDKATVDAAVGLKKITDGNGAWLGVQPGDWLVWDRQGAMQRRKVLGVAGNVITVDQDMAPGQDKACVVWGYSGMGAHGISVADVDGDGKDEIVYHAMVVGPNGKGLYTTGLRHGDALHVGAFDPDRPGLQVFGIHENENETRIWGSPGTALYDARTGEVIWSDGPGIDVGRGLCADIDPRYPGEEMWTGPAGLRTVKGEKIGEAPKSVNFAIWWDGDPLREILDSNRISKWDWQNGQLNTILEATECSSNNGSKSTPAVSADIFGDWREEVVWRTRDSRALRIYTTTHPTDRRIYTLMHDPEYRLAIAWQNVAYNQPPHPSFYIGQGMKAPPKPNITVARPVRVQ